MQAFCLILEHPCYSSIRSLSHNLPLFTLSKFPYLSPKLSSHGFILKCILTFFPTLVETSTYYVSYNEHLNLKYEAQAFWSISKELVFYTLFFCKSTRFGILFQHFLRPFPKWDRQPSACSSVCCQCPF